MKLMKIFGMVFALHVALACVLVLIQGCRSTPARTTEPEPAAAVAPAAEPAASSNWTNQPGAPTPATESSFGTAAPVSGPPLSSLSPAERERAAPTRPANPGSYISTSTPAALAPPPPEPIDYVVRSGDSLWKIAHAHNTNTAALQKLNPKVKANSLRPGMVIKVPGSGAAPTLSTAPSSPAGVALTAVAPATMSTYVVRAGDSLSKIAARNGTTVAALREANNLRSDVIQIGQQIQIPSRAEIGGAAFGVGELSQPAPGADGRGATGETGKVTVTVQRGDTLGGIAQKFDVTVSDLMAENNISDPKKVRVGQKLAIPGFHAVGTGAVPAAAPTTPARPAQAPPTTPPPQAPESAPPQDLPPPVLERPADSTTPSEEEAPPVQPIEGEPMPAP